MRPIAALLTDYGTRDTYVAEVKAVILKYCPDVVLVDITHEVTPFNVFEAAFLLKNAAKSFPGGTCFLAVVDPGVGSKRHGIAVMTKRGNVYVGPDNGLLYPASSAEGIVKIYRIRDELLYNVSSTFHGRDVFAVFAGLFMAKGPWDRLAEEKEDLVKVEIPEPKWGEGWVECRALHIDRFGNVILNIEGRLPNDWRSVKVKVGEKTFEARCVDYYSQASVGQPVLLVGGTGYLELSINQGDASKTYQITPGQAVILINNRS